MLAEATYALGCYWRQASLTQQRKKYLAKTSIYGAIHDCCLEYLEGKEQETL
jgi:hypothetical protein